MLNFFKKTVKVAVAASGSYTLTDDLHDVPFKNLTIWLRPLSSVNYSYSVDYGGVSQTSGTKTAGAMFAWNDAQILPPNQPDSNWSEHSDGDYYVVGLPINVNWTNTSGEKAIFLCSILSETATQMI